MVRVSAVPPTLIPSGSSAASRSARGAAPPSRPSAGTVTCITRRRAVRPDNDPPFRSASPVASVRAALAGLTGVGLGALRVLADEVAGGARDDIEIICEIARRLGADWGKPSAEELWNELRTLSPMHAGMSYRCTSTRRSGPGSRS